MIPKLSLSDHSKLVLYLPLYVKHSPKDNILWQLEEHSKQFQEQASNPVFTAGIVSFIMMMPIIQDVPTLTVLLM